MPSKAKQKDAKAKSKPHAVLDGDVQEVMEDQESQVSEDEQSEG